MKKPVDSKSVDQTELGAGACLKFLQEQEAKARNEIVKSEDSLRELISRRFKNLRADDGKTAEEWDKDIRIAQSYIEMAGDEHGKSADRLLKYEKAVAPEKRTKGESITQEEAADMLTNCAMHWRIGFEGLITRICQEAPLCKSSVEVEQRIRPLLCQCLTAQLDAALKDGKIASWAANALKDGM